MNVFVFRPGAPPATAENVFAIWTDVIGAMSGVEGRKILEFDDSISSPCTIPPGRWPMKDVSWAGFGPRSRPGTPRSVVDIAEGAVFSDLRMIGGQITIRNKATRTPPVSDFGPGLNHVQIGLRDDSGNTHIVNQGTVEIFDLGKENGLFFLQNCLFGISNRLEESNGCPLITQEGPKTRLVINILGQNQTGPNVVRSRNGATVLFNAIGGGAQVAAEQSAFAEPDSILFAPVGRIQRQIIPQPPKPPATASIGANDGFTRPNALLRFNGILPITQVLPKIKGEPSIDGQGKFTLGQLGTPLYTGGQEIIIAEVVGGRNLTIRAANGDTIDGDTGLIHVPGKSTRTLVSDGESTWITTSTFNVPGLFLAPFNVVAPI